MFYILNYILKLIKPQLVKIFILLFIFFVLNIIKLINPIIFKIIIDDVLPQKDIDKLIKLLILIIFIQLISDLIGYISKYYYSLLLSKIEYNFKIKFINHLIKIPLIFFNKTNAIEFLNYFKDIDSLNNVIDTLLFDFVTNLLSFIIFFIYGLKVNPILSIMILIGIPLFHFFNKYLGEIRKNKNQEIWEKQKKFYSFVNEIINLILSIKTLIVQNIIIKKVKHLLLDIRKSYLKTNLIINIWKVIENFISSFLNIIVFFMGIIFIIKGKLTIGEFFAFKNISSIFSSNLIILFSSFQSFKYYSANIERIEKIMLIKEENSEDGLYLEIKKGKIELQNLGFSYDDKISILNNINFVFFPSSINVIVGKNGKGKSTLSKILVRLYEINKGKILIDGIDIKKYNLNKLRNNILIVSQISEIFNDTIKFNITVGTNFYTYDDLINCSIQSNLLAFINKLPQRFDTVVGNGGIELSSGEKQKIMISRSLIKDPKIIIFDEPTSHFDKESKEIFINNLKKIKKDKTIIIITHDKEIINVADNVLIIK